MIQPEYINTKEQTVDLFIEALHPGQFKYPVSKLNICNIYVQLEGEYQDRQTNKQKKTVSQLVGFLEL